MVFRHHIPAPIRSRGITFHAAYFRFGPLSALILREKITSHRWVTVASGIIGVLVILRPGIAIFDIMAFAVFSQH